MLKYILLVYLNTVGLATIDRERYAKSGKLNTRYHVNPYILSTTVLSDTTRYLLTH